MLLRAEKEAPISRRHLDAIESGAAFDAAVHCPWVNRGCSHTAPMTLIGGHTSECPYCPMRCQRCATVVNAEELDAHATACTTSCPDCSKPLAPASVRVHSQWCSASDDAIAFAQTEPESPGWQQELAAMQQTQETDPVKLRAAGGAFERKAAAERNPNVANSFLRMAAETYACAIAVPALKKTSDFHALLARTCELQYELAESEVLRSGEDGDGLADDDDDLIDQGSATQMADDIAALAQMHGVGLGSKPEEVLVAIDTECVMLSCRCRS